MIKFGRIGAYDGLLIIINCRDLSNRSRHKKYSWVAFKECEIWLQRFRTNQANFSTKSTRKRQWAITTKIPRRFLPQIQSPFKWFKKLKVKNLSGFFSIKSKFMLFKRSKICLIHHKLFKYRALNRGILSLKYPIKSVLVCVLLSIYRAF